MEFENITYKYFKLNYNNVIAISNLSWEEKHKTNVFPKRFYSMLVQRL